MHEEPDAAMHLPRPDRARYFTNRSPSGASIRIWTFCFSEVDMLDVNIASALILQFHHIWVQKFSPGMLGRSKDIKLGRW